MFRFMRDFVEPYWKHILLVLIVIVLQVYFQINVLQETKRLIDVGIYQSNLSLINNVGIYMMILIILYGFTIVASAYLSSYISASVTCDVRESLFEKAVSLSSYDFNKFGVSTLMTRATADTTGIQIFMINFLRNALLIPIVIIGVIIAAAEINLILCGILVIAFVLTLIFMVVKSRQTIPLFNGLQLKLDFLNLKFKEKIEGARSIRAFGNQNYEIETFNELNDEFNDESLNAELKLYYLTPLALIIMNLAVLLIYYIGSIQLKTKMVQISDLILFFQYVTYFITCLGILPFIVNTLPKTIVATERLEEVLYMDETVLNNPSEDIIAEDTKSPLIEYKEVIFGYTGAKSVIADIHSNPVRGQPQHLSDLPDAVKVQ